MINIKFDISDSLFFEILLLKIRGECSSFVKRNQLNRQEVLEKEINAIRNNSLIDTNELNEKEIEFQEYRKKY